jgi:hypothetical protein
MNIEQGRKNAEVDKYRLTILSNERDFGAAGKPTMLPCFFEGLLNRCR